MKAVMKRAPKRPRSSAKALDPDLARWTGGRAGLALFAGRCTASDIESLDRIRAQRLYRKLPRSWRDFCTFELGSHRRNVERALDRFHEFGPMYFRVTRLVHVPPSDYRLIAKHIDHHGVHLDGSVIPICSAKRTQLAAAVTTLLRRVPARNGRPRDLVPATRMLKRLSFAAEGLANLDQPLDALDKMDLAELVNRIRHLATARLAA